MSAEYENCVLRAGKQREFDLKFGKAPKNIQRPLPTYLPMQNIEPYDQDQSSNLGLTIRRVERDPQHTLHIDHVANTPYIAAFASAGGEALESKL